MGSFERDQDAEADYEEVLDEYGNRRRSNKRTISRRPPMKHPSEEITVIPETAMPSVEPAEVEMAVENPPPPTKGDLGGKKGLEKLKGDVPLLITIQSNPIYICKAPSI